MSSTVKDLVVGSEIVFVERGNCELKGVPGAVGGVRCGERLRGNLAGADSERLRLSSKISPQCCLPLPQIARYRLGRTALPG